MYSAVTLQAADEFAAEYEAYVLQRNWYGPDVLFGLLYEFIAEGQQLLDIGIGTGYSSRLFYRAGLEISGVDGSAKMLEICRSKNMAGDLRKVDISAEKISFGEKKFDMVISFAVFHMISDLSAILGNINNLLKPGGLTGFSIIRFNPAIDFDFSSHEISGIYRKINSDSGIHNFRHSGEYCRNLLRDNHFELLKEVEIPGFKDEGEKKEIFFSLYIARKNNYIHS
jgi:predicted TPR repeat methyltransferase